MLRRYTLLLPAYPHSIQISYTFPSDLSFQVPCKSLSSLPNSWSNVISQQQRTPLSLDPQKISEVFTRRKLFARTSQDSSDDSMELRQFIARHLETRMERHSKAQRSEHVPPLEAECVARGVLSKFFFAEPTVGTSVGSCLYISRQHVTARYCMHVVFDSRYRCGCTLTWTVKSLLMLSGHCSHVGSPQISGFDWQGVLQRFRSHVDNCALLLAELEADGDSIRATFVHHIFFSGPSSIDMWAFADRNCQTS